MNIFYIILFVLVLAIIFFYKRIESFTITRLGFGTRLCNNRGCEVRLKKKCE